MKAGSRIRVIKDNYCGDANDNLVGCVGVITRVWSDGKGFRIDLDEGQLDDDLTELHFFTEEVEPEGEKP